MSEKPPQKEIKIPQADRLIGIAKETGDSLDQLQKAIKNLHEIHGAKKIQDLELEKTDKDLKIINFVQESIKNLLKKYGRDVNNTPNNNIHVLKNNGTGKYTGGRLYTGAQSATQGSVLVDRQKSDAKFATILFHELLHNKSFKVLQITEGEKPKLEPYRSGFAITTRDGEMVYFHDIEEAIIQLLTMRFYAENILNNEMFELNEPFEFSRQKEMKKLEQLIDELWENNRSDFKSREEIEELFINAQINGRLLPVARLIEKTFGKGSFRAIGKDVGHEDNEEDLNKKIQ